jgi:hypothetical protein
MWADLQTMSMSYTEIVQGVRPWNALGDFLNYWLDYTADRREEMIREPLNEPTEATTEQHRWAAYCTATVEYLCERYGVPCPLWISDNAYVLAEPWFTGLGASKPHVQARLLQEAPEAFRKRNVYCSPRAFANKYEVATEVRQRQSA